MNYFVLKKIFFLTLILCVACQNTNQSSMQKNNTADDICKLTASNFVLKSDIWRISKSGKPISYIVGSFHARKEKDQLPIRIKKIIPDIDVIITENPLSENPQYSQDTKFKEYLDSMIYDKPQLESIIGKDLYNDIVKFHEKNTNLNSNFVINSIDYIKPWFFVIELPRYLVRKNFTYDTGYESLIYLEAYGLKKQFDFFEDKITIPNLLSDIPNYHIVAQINRFIHYDDNISDNFNKLYQAFSNRKYFELVKLKNKELTSYYNDKDEEKFWSCFNINKLLFERNKKWESKILNNISQQRTLIVVNFYHLLGTNGLLEFLKNQGYKIEAIND